MQNPITVLRTLIAVALVAVLACACNGGGSSGASTPTAPPSAAAGSCLDPTQSGASNLLLNPGFESGPEPWVTLAEASGFQVTTDIVHTGAAGALLQMRDSAEETGRNGSKVYYLVQEITPDKMPDFVCGFYRVENWVKASRTQYLQFVVIAFAPTNFPTTYPNYQIRFILAGADSPPFAIDNAHFDFITRAEPPIGQWVPFAVPVKDEFQRLWGKVPEGFQKLRLLFEVRWDNKVAGESIASADAYYDDLYAGPVGGSP